MRTNTTHTSNTTNNAGVPPAPPEAHQRADRESDKATNHAAEEVQRPVVCHSTMRGDTLINAVLLARIHQQINQFRGVEKSDIDDANFESAYAAAHAQGFADYFAGIANAPHLFNWDALLVKGWKQGFADAFTSQTEVTAKTEVFHSNEEH